jgi:hypothetical protein
MAQQPVSVETLKAIASAFNAHDLDAIMAFFADDCSLDMPRGPDPWGQRYVGKAAVREGLASRARASPRASKVCLMFTTATLAIGCTATWGSPNGFSPARRRRAATSACAAAITGSSATEK